MYYQCQRTCDRCGMLEHEGRECKQQDIINKWLFAYLELSYTQVLRIVQYAELCYPTDYRKQKQIINRLCEHEIDAEEGSKLTW